MEQPESFPFLRESIDWLLENDTDGVRFLALRNLLAKRDDDPDLLQARRTAYAHGQIGRILGHMKPEGYWNTPGGGYSPKYYSTVWSLILLSQIGASVRDDDRITTACRYYLDHAISPDGSVSHNGTSSGTFDCLAGNMCAALTDLGYNDDRLDRAYDWMARSQIGDIPYRYMKCGPAFACGANGRKPCAWGAVKVLLALGKIPEDNRSRAVRQAIESAVGFLLSVDPMTAAYPTAQDTKPNASWWKLGFPTFYCTDLLQLAEALTLAGYGNDPRLSGVWDFILSKRSDRGQWNLEHDYTGKTWAGFGKKGEPNKWVTYRVLRALGMRDSAPAGKTAN